MKLLYISQSLKKEAGILKIMNKSHNFAIENSRNILGGFDLAFIRI